MNHPLLPVCAALAAGIFAGMHGRLTRAECLGLASAAALVALVALRRQRNTAAVAAALLGVFLAGNFFFLHEQNDRPRGHIERLVAERAVDLSEPVRLTGWVTRRLPSREFSEAFDLALERVESLRQAHAAGGTVRLYHYLREEDEPPLHLAYGQRLSVLTKIRKVHGFHNPGSFDREARARREGVVFQGNIKTGDLLERLPGRGGNFLSAALDRARHALLARLDRLYPREGPPDPTNAILRAMLLGDRSGLDRRTGEDFEMTGTFHALVIAGLHTAALGVFLMLVLRLLRLPRLPATFLAIGGLAFFASLAGMRVPVVRATIMFSLYLLARLIFRQRALLNTIAAAALLLLAWHPSELADAGFQLSFYCVLLIAALGVPIIGVTSASYRLALRDLDNKDFDLVQGPRMAAIRDRLRGIGENWRPFLTPARMSLAGRVILRTYELVVVGVVIQVGFVLPMAAYFYRGGWVAVPANLLVVPLIGLVVPLGALTLALAMISTTLAALPAVPLAWGVAAMMAVARWHAGFSIAARRVPPPPAWLGATFVAALALVAVLLAARRPRWAAAATAPVLALAIVITVHPFAPQLPRDRLEITALDVGQGDALLVVTPPGRTLLIDAGGARDPEFGIDPGADVVGPYLWTRGIRRLDAVALTHAHQDHIGGLYAVLQNFPVGELWLGKNPEDSEVLAGLKAVAAARGVPVVERRRGQSLPWGEARLEFLSPADDYHPGRRPGNNDSLVMRLSYKGRTALLPGDVERKIERELVTLPLRADLLKVPHHGSKTSSNEDFLEKVKAPYGIISVSANSPFGHPHDEALERLWAARMVVRRTDKDGAITWASDGHRVWVKTFLEEQPKRPSELW